MKRNSIWIRKKGLELGLFPSAAIIAPGLRICFHSRRNGASVGPYESLNIGMTVGDSPASVRRNRELLLDAAGVPEENLALAEQVHGSVVAVARRGALHDGADGLVTREKDLALAVSTADCYPVVIHSPPERVLAALHVGRNGAAEGIIERGMTLMRDSFRIDPSASVAFIGPGICAGCYEIGWDEAKRFRPAFRERRGGRYRLDLLSFCREELRRCGIPAGHVFEAGLCTSCDPRLFFSYRRDGGVTGRHWMLAMMTGVSRWA